MAPTHLGKTFENPWSADDLGQAIALHAAFFSANELLISLDALLSRRIPILFSSRQDLPPPRSFCPNKTSLCRGSPRPDETTGCSLARPSAMPLHKFSA